MAKHSGLVAVIPARAGSKRIPAKNIRDFFGHPMLAYSVAAARATRLFDRVIVSTDDPQIGRVAEWYGADYLPRPRELATDLSVTADVALHALDVLAAQGVHPESICQLQPNCPLRRGEDVVAQHELFVRRGNPFQISVVPYRGVNPHWTLAADGQGFGQWVFGAERQPQSVRVSQNLDTVYCFNGAICWTRVEDFRKQRTYCGDPFTLAPMDGNRGIDIDGREDLEFAEVVVLGLWKKYGKSPLEPISRERFAIAKAASSDAV